MFTAYADFVIDLIVNIATIFLLAYVLYFRRHRRADLLLAYVALNIGIFVVISLLTSVRLDVALGFGLFAILSIIRLRSSTVTQQEVAYYFVALVTGLVNGMDLPDRRLLVLINVLLLGAMAIVDSKPLRERTRRMDVHLDVVHADDAALVADLERRLGGTVLHYEVNDVDYVRQTTLVDVRFRAGTQPVLAPVDERQLEATLDVIHADDAALVADLERRLGGQVLSHHVKDIDYVRDTMEVEVTYRAWTPVAHRNPAGHAGHYAGQNGFGQNGFGQNGFGQNGFGQNGFGRTASGRTASGRTASGRTALGRTVLNGATRRRRRCGREHHRLRSARPARPAHVLTGHGEPRRAGRDRSHRNGRPDRPGRADGARRTADAGGPQVLRPRRRVPSHDRRAVR